MNEDAVWTQAALILVIEYTQGNLNSVALRYSNWNGKT